MSVVNDDDSKVFVVTSEAEGFKAGFVLTWVSAASLNRQEPKIIMLVSKFNASLAVLEKSRSFCLNLLTPEQYDEFCIFGLKSIANYDKFKDFKHNSRGRGVELSGCSAYVHGRIDEIFSTPDRKILYCTVEEEKVTNLPHMILHEMLGRLQEPWKSELHQKFERDSLRDGNQFL